MNFAVNVLADRVVDPTVLLGDTLVHLGAVRIHLGVRVGVLCQKPIHRPSGHSIVSDHVRLLYVSLGFLSRPELAPAFTVSLAAGFWPRSSYLAILRMARCSISLDCFPRGCLRLNRDIASLRLASLGMVGCVSRTGIHHTKSAVRLADSGGCPFSLGGVGFRLLAADSAVSSPPEPMDRTGPGAIVNDHQAQRAGQSDPP